MKARLHGQRGLTLPELLVAMAVGLAVLLAAGALLVSANAAYVAQVDSAAADDGGRYALEAIGRSLRQTAYVDWEQGAPTGPAVAARLGGLDARTLSKATAAIADPLPEAVNGSDVLAARFPGAADGSVTDCAGFPVNASEEGWSIFYVARSAQGVAELRCKYHGDTGWSADAVVSGVDGFQVLYGLDTDAAPDGVANRYVNAATLEALDSALVLAGSSAAEREQDRLARTVWKRIVSVKVALLLHGAQATRVDPAAVYDLFGQAYGDALSANDHGTRLREPDLAPGARGREHKLFAAVYALRGTGR